MRDRSSDPIDFRVRFGPRPWRERILSWPWRPWVSCRFMIVLSPPYLKHFSMEMQNQITSRDTFRSVQNVKISAEADL